MGSTRLGHGRARTWTLCLACRRIFCSCIPRDSPDCIPVFSGKETTKRGQVKLPIPSSPALKGLLIHLRMLDDALTVVLTDMGHPRAMRAAENLRGVIAGVIVVLQDMEERLAELERG